ncbi:hypothetical protein ACIBH0_40135 [Streptosporangium canum]|uniref:hypothetical protein n=1 Tax=Streptosporangium canum TaxID=324952 RepID=UPI0037A8DA27
MDDLVALLRARGRNQSSAAGTLVERTAHYTMLVHLPIDHSAERMRDAMVDTVQALSAHLKRSPAWGQSGEMGRHHEFSTAAGFIG